MNEMARKTITIHESTFNALDRVGTTSESFDDAIRRLLTVYHNSEWITLDADGWDWIIHARVRGRHRRRWIGRAVPTG